MTEIFETLSNLITTNIWIAPIIAIAAGVLTAFTPCSLSTIPLIIGYVSGKNEDNTKRAFKLSVVFAIGMAITFTLLGIIASIFGKIMIGVGKWWFIFLGIIMLLMALQTYEVFTFIKPTYLNNKNTKKGYLGALLSGILGGIFASPCTTPVLVALLTLVSSSGNILWGTFLLLLYSIGNSVLVIICRYLNWAYKEDNNK